MFIKRNKNQAFSLVEVVVATIVFLIAAAGIFNIFFMAQNLTTDSGDEIIAINYGRQLLEDLRATVDTRTWGTWSLTCDSAWHAWPTAPAPGDAFSTLTGGAVDYRCEPEASGIRRVTLNVTW